METPVIVDLPATTTGAITKRMIGLRDSSGTILNRVLNLIVVLDKGADLEAAVETAKEATREHPCRVLILVPSPGRGAAKLDGQIRVGGDAGASEIIVLTLHGELAKHADSVALALLLPDTPVVTWWPGDGPVNPSDDPLGKLAQRRLVDASHATRPIQRLYQRAPYDTAADTDLGWARTTRWRGVLAAALDQEPFEQVTRALVVGSPDSPSNELLAAWLGLKLQCPVGVVHTTRGDGIVGVKLFRKNGSDITLIRPEGSSAVLTQPGQPDRRISLPRRPDRDVLAEELRRLDPDEIYAEVVERGLPLLKRGSRQTVAKAISKGDLMSLVDAAKLVKSVAARDRKAARAMGRPDDAPAAAATPAKKSPAKKTSAKRASATRTVAKKTTKRAGAAVSSPRKRVATTSPRKAAAKKA